MKNLSWLVFFLPALGRIFAMLNRSHSPLSGHFFCLRTMCCSQGAYFLCLIFWAFFFFLSVCLSWDAKMHFCFNRKYQATLMTCLLFDPVMKVIIFCLMHIHLCIFVCLTCFICTELYFFLISPFCWMLKQTFPIEA